MPQDPRRAEWFRYYSGKRIYHQWFQVHLLRDLDVTRVLEVGPGLGLVTAMLGNAGFAVTTLDLTPAPDEDRRVGRIAAPANAIPTPDRLSQRGRQLPLPVPVPILAEVQSGLRTVSGERLAGFDCILCCETLEHLYWHEVDGVLAKFRHSGARHVVLSVPYEGLQLDIRLYLNRFKAAQSVAFRKLRFLRSFRFDAVADPQCHKWEVGYRGTSLRALERKLKGAGFRIRRRDFTSPCRSVFFVLDNP